MWYIYLTLSGNVDDAAGGAGGPPGSLGAERAGERDAVYDTLATDSLVRARVAIATSSSRTGVIGNRMNRV